MLPSDKQAAGRTFYEMGSSGLKSFHFQFDFDCIKTKKGETST